MLVFLDTNILLDVLLDRASFVEESEAVIVRCEEAGAGMFISWHGLATVYYLIKRGRTEAQALSEVDKILAWARVTACADGEARRARTLEFRDFEDALQAISAEACAADLIVTRNVPDFSKSPVPAVTPKEFLRLVPKP